jgi:hypothetical protein
MQPDSNTQITANDIHHERSAIGSREVLFLGTPVSSLALGSSLASSPSAAAPASSGFAEIFPVGAQHAVPGLPAVAGAELPDSLPRARSHTVDVSASSAGIRPEPIRSAHSISVSNRNIPRLELHLTVAISTDNSFLIATKHTNRTFVFFLDTEAQRRHLKSAAHYAYLSRDAFLRQNLRHTGRERAADVFGVKTRNSNRRKPGN